MHASLGFGGGNTLHAVHARLVFQRAVDLLAADGADDFLVSARGSLSEAGNLHAPPLALAIFGIHAEEVAGKDGRLVASRSSAYFEDGVAVVFGVGGDEQQLDALLDVGQAGFAGGGFLACHVAHLGVGLGLHQLLGLGQRGEAAYVFGSCLHQFAQLLVFLGQPHVAALVGNDGGVGNECRHLFEACHEAV